MTYQITAHAVERYQERVKPALSFRAAANEIDVLVRQAEFTAVQPEWLPGRREVDGFLVVCDSIAFVVTNGFVLTCLVRAGMGEGIREGRNASKRGRRRARRRAQTSNQANNFIRRESKSQPGRSRRLARSLFARTELSLDDEMASAGAGTAPEARPMEVGP